MAKRTLQLHTPNECKRLHNMVVYIFFIRFLFIKKNCESSNSNLYGLQVGGGITHIFCTTGCSMRTGAPLVVHASNGLFELVGISSASGICIKETDRTAFNDPPVIWIDIYPFNTWIINVVTAHVMPLPYPNTFGLSHSDDGKYIKYFFRYAANAQKNHCQLQCHSRKLYKTSFYRSWINKGLSKTGKKTKSPMAWKRVCYGKFLF